MDRIQEHLIKLSDDFDKKGKKVCADTIDSLISSKSVQKVAQYVGVIGYVLKQNRAIANCIRRKKADSRSMQEKVLECLKEYQDGQNYNDTEWTQKYAQVIESKPELFNKSYIPFLKSIADASDITKEINKIKTANNTLKINGHHDSIINDLMKHYDSLSEYMSGGNSENFFKLAARPQRSNWSRFWNPSQTSWYNPLSWSAKKRSRGDESDTKFEMSEIIKNLENIKFNIQRMKTTISRVKSEASGYSAGTYQDLGSQTESTDIVKTIVSKVNELDSGDWHKSILSIQQLKHLLQEQSVKNSLNKEILDRTFKLVNSLYESADTVYQSIDTTQELMRDLRQRSTVIGTQFGLKGEGEPNPYGMSSPAEEYAALDRVLNQLYRNPFDDKTIWYAEKLHARLDDKLRYIERPEDLEMVDWLRNKEHASPTTGKLPPEFGQEQEEQTETNQPTALNPISQEQIEKTVNSINRSLIATPEDREKMLLLIANLHNVILNALGNSPHNSEIINNLFSGVADGINTPNNATNPVQNTPETNNVETPVTNETNPATNEIPKNDNEKIPDPNEDSWPPKGAVKTPLPDKLGSIYELIKIADILDKLDPKIGDILDEIIKKENKKDFDFKDFSSFSFPIKEEYSK